MNFEQEKDRLDFITDEMNSMDFLDYISSCIFDEVNKNKAVGVLYDEWLRSFGDGEVRVPISIGSMVGYMYCGILFAKENWFDLLPDKNMDELEESFGFKGVTYSYPLVKEPKFKQIVKRMRNALGHGNINVYVSEDIEMKNRYHKVFFTFKDENMKNSSDTFEITLSFYQITLFIRKFQSIIHKYVREKKEMS